MKSKICQKQYGREVYLVLSERYHLIRCLSDKQGKTVYLAEHKQLGVKRIIKQLHKDSPLFEVHNEEVNLMKNLCHPCIPIIFDTEHDSKSVYIVEQYMEGASLRLVLEQYQLSETEFFNYLIQLCNILLYLHSLTPPVIHLDIKPENIIVNEGRLALIDFGCAIAGDTDNCRSKYIQGTPGYMAPERKNANGRTDVSADIYSFGCLLNEMLLTSNIKPKTMKALKKLGACCIAAKKAYRLQSMKKIKQCLEKLQSRQKRDKENTIQPRKIAVAGASRRAGATHIALLIGTYLKQKGKQCLYIERNESGMVKSTGEIIGRGIPSGRKYHFLGNELVPSSWETYISCPAMEQIDYIIYDYGELSEDNLDSFCSSDIKLLVSGGRPWEMNALKEKTDLLEHASDDAACCINAYDNVVDNKTVVKKTADNKTVACLINLTESKLLSGIRGLFRDEYVNSFIKFYDVPYVSELIFKNNKKGVKKRIGALFNEIL